MLPSILISLLFVCCSIVHSEEANARAVEKSLISLFESQNEISTREDLIKEIGPFIDPPEFKHSNYKEMTAELEELANRFPNLTHLYSAGQSVEGRELWVLVVSKYPNKHQIDVPEFKYVANMHGNEVTGRVFLLSLAWTLLNNYKTNSYMRKLVDTTRIHMMPSMNPDGYERGIEGDDSGVRGRTNANGKDLNRNFPGRYPNFFPTEVLQPETAAVMNWTKSIPFVLSANLHGGTTIVNYPFDDFPTRSRDHKYSPAPDNELFVRLAYSYARAHERMWKPGPRCLDDNLNVAVDPQQGIVNGAHWYIVPGGMQDWNYLNTNCIELTVEINCVKFPWKKDLRYLWNENKYSLLHYINQVHNAIHGRIVDASNGRGIVNATISIDLSSKIMISYGDGEFWRLVNLGTYEVTFDHPSYIPQTRRISVTKDRRSPYVAVALERLHPNKTEHKDQPTNEQTTSKPARPTTRPVRVENKSENEVALDDVSSTISLKFLEAFLLLLICIF